MSDWLKKTFAAVQENVTDPVKNFVEDDVVSFVEKKVMPFGQNDVFGENGDFDPIQKKVIEPVSGFIEERITPEVISVASSIKSWVKNLFG